MKPLARQVLIYGIIIKIKEDTWDTFGKLSSVGTPESREFRPLSWSLSVWRDDHDDDGDDADDDDEHDEAEDYDDNEITRGSFRF